MAWEGGCGLGGVWGGQCGLGGVWGGQCGPGGWWWLGMEGLDDYMCFQSRYCELLLLHHDISVQSARSTHAAILSEQLSQLLGCTELLDSLFHQTAPITPTILCGSPSPSIVWQQVLCFISIEAGHMPSHVASGVDRALRTASESLGLRGDIDLSPVGMPAPLMPRSEVKGRRKKPGKPVRGDGLKVPSMRLVGVRAELACARARCLLAGKQAMLTQQVLKATLTDIGRECRDHDSSLALAWLHYYMGVATAQQLEEEEAEQEGVWFEGTADSQLHEQCVEEFMQCYQLCFPTMPTILLRETCLWLALLLTEPDHAHHFMALSQHISLMHETMLSLGKKLR